MIIPRVERSGVVYHGIYRTPSVGNSYTETRGMIMQEREDDTEFAVSRIFKFKFFHNFAP